MGLATAINRLRKHQQEQGRILLTDGMNNAGTIQPLDAALIAEELRHSRVHTIGVGTRGRALSPVATHPNGQIQV